MKRIGIFGTSGFAREVADVADRLGIDALFVAENEAARSAWTGEEDVILESEAGRYADLGFAIGIGAGRIRQRVAERHGQLRFANLIDPCATFGKGQLARLAASRGVVICAGVRFMSGIDVGDFAAFDVNATIGHDSSIGPYAHVAPGANIAGHVRIEERAWIGAGAVVNQGRLEAPLVVGRDTVVGSGAVVTASCAGDSVYVGVPAKRRP